MLTRARRALPALRASGVALHETLAKGCEAVLPFEEDITKLSDSALCIRLITEKARSRCPLRKSVCCLEAKRHAYGELGRKRLEHEIGTSDAILCSSSEIVHDQDEIERRSNVCQQLGLTLHDFC